MIPGPTGTVARPGGRAVAFDDLGGPPDRTVFWVPGFGDSRLTRPPDARVAGARVVTVDRPGYGASDADVHGSYSAVADDIVAIADAVAVESFAVLAWSSGAAVALACAAEHGDRIRAVGVAAGNPPVEADADPAVRAAMDDVLATRTEVAAELGPEGFASLVAPMAALDAPTVDLALEYVREGKDAAYLRDLASVPGLDRQLAIGAAAATQRGLAGAEFDLRCQVSPWGFTLDAIGVPVVLWYGTDDAVLRPPVGRWLAERIAGARLRVFDGASHLLPLVHWRDLFTELATVAFEKESSDAAQP